MCQPQCKHFISLVPFSAHTNALWEEPYCHPCVPDEELKFREVNWSTPVTQLEI